MKIVITQVAAVTVPKDVYEKIQARTDTDPEYGATILFMISVPDRFKTNIKLPAAPTYEDFSAKFLPNGKCVKCGHPYGGTGKRNIIV